MEPLYVEVVPNVLWRNTVNTFDEYGCIISSVSHFFCEGDAGCFGACQSDRVIIDVLEVVFLVAGGKLAVDEIDLMLFH